MTAKALIYRLFWGDSAAERRWGVALALVFAVLAIFLRVSGSDWREAVSERQAKTEKRYEREGREFVDAAAREHAVFKSVKLEHWVKSGSYWAGLANLFAVGGLLVTRRRWLGGKSGTGSPATGRAGARFWLVVGGTVLLALAVRMPRMGLSLYNDEAYNFRHYIHGQFKGEDNAFDAVTWQQTFWKNKANNGVPFSALARAGYDLWSAKADAALGEINEPSLRWAALVPGLLSIVVVASLGRRLGGGLAGGAVAVWLALHPWHIRYCTEARPYGLVLLFAALMLLCAYEAVRRDRWRWWFGFAIAQFALVWSFAGAVYFAAGLNVAVLAFCLMSGRSGPAARLAVCGVLSAMLYLQLMAPCFPQMLHTLSTVESFSADVGSRLVADIGSFLVVGMPALDADPENAWNPALSRFGLPLITGGLVAVLLLIVGWFRGAGRAEAWWFIVGGSVLAFGFALAMSAYSGSVLHRWYVIYLLPSVALVLAAGWAWCWQQGRGWRVAGCLAVAGLLVFWQRPLRTYLAHGKESLREVAALASEDGAVVCGFWTNIKVYASELVDVRGVSDLEKAVEMAGAHDTPLSVVFCHRKQAQSTMPECVAFVESDAFERVGVFPGLGGESFTTFLYRWRGGGDENRSVEGSSTAPETGP